MVVVTGPKPNEELFYIKSENGYRYWRGLYGDSGTKDAQYWAQKIEVNL